MFYTGIYLRKLKRATLQGGHFLEWTAKLHFESIGRIPGHFSFSRFVEFEAEPPLWHAILSRKLRFDTQSALFAAHLLKGKKCKDKYTHDTNSLRNHKKYKVRLQNISRLVVWISKILAALSNAEV